MNKQKGFTALVGIVIVAVLLLIGFAGWRVWDSNQSDNSSDTNTTEDQSFEPENAVEQEEEIASEPKKLSEVISYTLPDDYKEHVCDDEIIIIKESKEESPKCNSDQSENTLVIVVSNNNEDASKISCYSLSEKKVGNPLLIDYKCSAVEADNNSGIREVYTEESNGSTSTFIKYTFLVDGDILLEAYHIDSDSNHVEAFDSIVESIKFKI